MLNVRPNVLVIIPLLPLCIFWNGFKKKLSLKNILISLLLYSAGISLALSPFIVKKYSDTGRLFMTTGQSGYTLYLGNNINNPDPYFRPVPFASSSPVEQGTQMIIEASRREGKKLTPREASNYWQNEVFKMASGHPGAFIWRICQKILVLFNHFEAGDHYDIGFISNFAGFFKLPFLSFWVVLPFGMLGITTTGFRSRILISNVLIFLFYASTLVIFFTNARFRLPLMVILIPFAVNGIYNLIQKIYNLKIGKIAFWLLVPALIVIIEFLPVRGTDDMTAYYNTHAIILISKGFEKEAIAYWEKSSGVDKYYSDFA